jgi:hypothetical protein
MHNTIRSAKHAHSLIKVSLCARLTTDKVTLVYPKVPAPRQTPVGHPTGRKPDGGAGANPTANQPRPRANVQKRLVANPSRTTVDQRLTPYDQAMMIRSLTVEDAIDDGFFPTPPEPDHKGRGKNKGKREATPQGNRRQPPHKQARNDTYPPYYSSNPPRKP